MRAGRRCGLVTDIGLLVGTAALWATQAPAPKQVSGEAPPSEAADKAEFDKVCGGCHTPDMVSDMRTGPEWEQTVEQMVSIGAKGTDEQMEAVVRVPLGQLT